MGAYVSKDGCVGRYNITINCDYKVNDSTPTIGGYEHLKVPTDPDIAGSGIIYTFIGVTSFSLLLSLIHISWTIWKNIHLKPSGGEDKDSQEGAKKGFSLSELCEELVLGCSDTQHHTAYHYDIVANMMLLTCATHLMSITITRNYWVYPWLGLVRLIVCLGIFVVTGILLANQNAPSDRPFPSFIPAANVSDSQILLPAACFQAGNSQLLSTLDSSFGKNSANAFLFSQPGNRIPGWNNYLFILLWYCVAFIADVIRFFRRGMVHELEPQASKQQACFNLRCFMTWVLSLYLLGGIGISAWTVYQSATYITGLRTWARHSGWLELEDGGQSAEDDATSFGQLVPIFLNLLLVFTVAQLISSKAATNWGDRKFDRFGDLVPNSGAGNNNKNNGPGFTYSDGVTVQRSSLQPNQKPGFSTPTAVPVSPVSPYAPPSQSYTPVTAQFAETAAFVQSHSTASPHQIGRTGPAETGSSYFPSTNIAQ
ncbi:hypothetical protein GQ53DRAFT_828629 [Thozetella sp. PMI_491]|nr:hypothetical protein GQ53DRAFT_828629 [Thozetella sp. PMI_491]